MSRQRMTWEKDGGDQRVLPVERAASAHPAYPDEGPASPAYEPDPDADKYENGDTSSWAEDPTTGPYPDSAHPAYPDEGPASPAYRSEGQLPPNEPGGEQMTNEDLGVSKAAAEEIKLATEKKAAKCIRIATPLLARFTRDADIIEDQALDLMGLSDEAIHSTLDRLAKLRRQAETEEKKEKDEAEGEAEAAETVQEEAEEKAKAEKKADDALLRRLLAEEGMIAADESDDEAEDEEAADEDDKEGGKKKAGEDVLAQIQETLAALTEKVNSLSNGPVAQDEVVEEVDEDEALLEAMLQEEGMEDEAQDDVESMLYSMLHEEGMDDEAGDDCVGCDQTAQDEEEEVAEALEVEMGMDDEDVEAQLDIDMAPVDDPMGLLDETELDDEDDALLANLFADSRLAAEDDEDEESEDEESEDEGGSEDEDAEEEPPGEGDKESGKKKASKTASTRKPRPKKASKGVSRLGGVQQQNVGDVSELEALWPTAPDVSKVFE